MNIPNGSDAISVGLDCVVSGVSSQGVQIRANCLRLNRHAAVIEVYTPELVLQASEALSEFKLIANGRLLYSGRAVVKNLIANSGSGVCEVTLEEAWVDIDPISLEKPEGRLTANYEEFLRITSKGFKVLPQFKLVVAEMQMFLLDLRQWIDQIEFGLRDKPTNERDRLEREVLQSVEKPVITTLNHLFERFEHVCGEIEPDLRPVHSHYVKRQLHPIVLCSPFMYRSFQKPLGYAGDYEMVNMMIADSYRGTSSFARMLNTYFLSTPPVVAHQNRIEVLTRMLVEETCRKAITGKPIKFFNLGCGPALEIQEFLAASELSNRADFTLLDFNDETISHVSTVLPALKARHRRQTKFHCIKRSVIQILKERARSTSALLGGGYDVVYCAGLFDYLADPVCEKLMATFYEMLAPGGLLVATNVHEINPSRNWMEYSVDWHLIHRGREEMLRICPKAAPEGAAIVRADPTGLNLFSEVRKPEND